MTSRSAAPGGARFRTITLAGIAGICTAVGPLALPAVAASDPALSLSTSGVRPGVPFTVSAATGCPADYGTQTVDFSFTDSEGTYSLLSSTETGDDGSWAATSLTLPVIGVDADGGWQGEPLATGAGTLDATCTAADSGDDFGDDLDAASIAPGDADDSDEPGDDAGDDAGDLGVTTQSYAAANLSVTGSAPQLTVSPALAQPGGSITVAPASACPGGSAGSVGVAVVQLGAVAPDDGSDDGSDDIDSASIDSAGVVAEATATMSSTGIWSAVSLTLPAGADTGDYAVTADCLASGKVAGSYDADPIALGTLTVAAPVCSANGAALALKGSYAGDVAVSTGKRELTLPARVALRGSGPWNVEVSSATTGLTLARQTVTCPKPAFDLDVPRTTVGATGKVRANVCNTGKRTTSAVLQVARGGRFVAVDDQKLAAGDCEWLTGGKVARGDSLKARVLLDAPGGSSDEVSASFTAHRGRR